MFALLFAVFLAQQAPAELPPLDTAKVTISAPRKVAEVETGSIKGELIGFAWAGDGALLYMRSAEYDRWRNEKAHHYLIETATGKFTTIEAMPSWAASYWAWKSGYAAPGVPDMKLETETQSKMVTAVGSVSDGGLSQSRADPSQSQVMSDHNSAQQVATLTVRLKGNIIIQSVNKSVQAGAVWGWAPAPMGGLAFVDGKKRLAVADRTGRSVDVAGTSEVMMPAWSPDGRRIAFIQKLDKKKYTVSVVEVSAK